MSATATLRKIKEVAEAQAKSDVQINLEEADRIVSELIKSSTYVEEGKQRLYEAILMVSFYFYAVIKNFLKKISLNLKHFFTNIPLKTNFDQ